MKEKVKEIIQIVDKQISMLRIVFTSGVFGIGLFTWKLSEAAPLKIDSKVTAIITILFVLISLVEFVLAFLALRFRVSGKRLKAFLQDSKSLEKARSSAAFVRWAGILDSVNDYSDIEIAALLFARQTVSLVIFSLAMFLSPAVYGLILVQLGERSLVLVPFFVVPVLALNFCRISLRKIILEELSE